MKQKPESIAWSWRWYLDWSWCWVGYRYNKSLWQTSKPGEMIVVNGVREREVINDGHMRVQTLWLGIIPFLPLCINRTAKFLELNPGVPTLEPMPTAENKIVVEQDHGIQ